MRFFALMKVGMRSYDRTGQVIAQIIAIHKQKRDNRKGYLSFVGGASFLKVEPMPSKFKKQT